jgi:trimeric autotransporter adhesin
MSDQKISELTALTGANVADTDLLPIVDTSATETKKITFGEFKSALDTATGFVRINGDTMTGNLSFGDNNKAIFGAGSDLEIYHSGTASHIKETGTGNLKLEGSNIEINNGSGTKTYILAADGGAVQLRYDDATKLATTATGIDVTGTVTADGLTVDGNITSTGGDLNLATLDLNAISATIADTAVDIFVYDTSKDSDGGAWRKRTQGTSWYNETLGTGTRGARKEFPSVAVIVAESSQVTIYDGDDPDLPMWMVFNNGGTAHGSDNVIGASGDTMSSISMLSGIMMIGTNAARLINFVSEVAYRYSTSGAKPYNGTIAERNSGKGTGTVIASLAIVNNTVNDVAMTVLPNAPIDAATGLPVPTIAVGCASGGTSVITDSGAVYDLTGFAPVENVNFYGDKLAINTPVGSNSYAIIGSANFSSDTTDGVWREVYLSSGATDIKILSNQAAHQAFHGTYYSAGSNGLVSAKPDYTAPETSLHAFTTSTYNTGWMNGAIKLATLSDTDDTDVTGAELVTNGTFATDTTGWTAANSGVLSVDSARLKITNGIASAGRAHQAITVVVGKTYTISVEGITGTSGPNIRIGNAANGADYGSSTADGVSSFTITPTQTTIYITLKPNSNTNGSTALFDNVTARLAEEDRSVNGNGLQVFGTVTKTAVATGADLVAYSGFSGSNYLEQPYNADLQFGTGDFCFSYWIKFSSIAGENIYSTVGTGTSSGTEGVAANTAGSGTFGFAVYTNGIQSSGRTNCGFTYTPSTNTWICVQNVRRSGVLELWINGELDTSVANTADINATDSFTRLGGHSSGSVGGSTSLSLFRASATAPTADQIAKIYEDEKVLFQENAQATLYGSSDAVTALAYDDTTELLHVGTSQGRSVFQGLRRVDNTTSAVGAAISASNGLVAED